MWSQRNVSPGSTVIALRGKVKSETAARAHLLPCVHVTSSGIDLRMWMDLCLLENQEEGRTDGPATQEGLVMSAAEIDEYFHAALIRVLGTQPSLYPPDIRTPEGIKAKIQSFISIRRSSNARAVNQAISKIYVDTVNRWDQQERAGAKKQAWL
jgi:hypothetical protein